ncbi:MAG: DUF1566 domain-containing protein [Candidatus Marinimicrobia bacterium]|nr:DUF1566 domain-containing protein [Candidatus Neomarinimicrobiota bacterium]
MKICGSWKCNVGVLAGLLFAGAVLAGSLDPTDPPGSTMRTLQDIYDKLEEIDGKVQNSVAQTGQTTSYQAGDDGDHEQGVAWPNPRYTDHGDTVTDNLTGLMWTKNSNLPGGTRNWSGALEYCNNMNSGAGTYGYTDWRLPNVCELQSLIDYGRFNPALPSGHPFTNVGTDLSHWSSTTDADNTSHAWYVRMYDGSVRDAGSKTSAYYYVWPVRGGK